WVDGDLSGGQVQAIVANIDDHTAALFAEHEASLLPALRDLTVGDTASAMQTWRARADAVVDRPARLANERSLHLSETLDGRRELTGSFDATSGAVVETALRLATTDDVEGEPARTLAQRRADALTDICRYFL